MPNFPFPDSAFQKTAWLAAIAVPVYYLIIYTPLGMDTTDFGYFYGYAWRILQGQIPYRDFFYIKPALPLYWHAFWMSLTPQTWQILAGKAGFCLTLLAASWLGALYLSAIFSFKKLHLNLPIFATASFVFSIHTFPHMPWHTADGVLFCAAALLASAYKRPVVAGLFCAAAVLCKQSFMLVPVGIGISIYSLWPKRQLLAYLCAFFLALGAWFLWIFHHQAWDNFRAMTTGQLDMREALDAGIFIYLRQNWFLPVISCAPVLLAKLCRRQAPAWLAPAYCYLACLSIWYVGDVCLKKIWVGFGVSWPTLFMMLGCAAVCWPGKFLSPYWRLSTNASKYAASCAYAAMLLGAWSVAISGGYKIPAFFTPPLLFAFYLWHAVFFGPSRILQWAILATGLFIFACGYQYPYIFPQRPLTKSELVHDAGEVYAKARGVKVDADMLERLKELKELRQKYGPNYKTLPGFSLAYYLNDDMPVIASDWLIDWEINGQIDKLYDELMQKNVIVFMERDQLDSKKADNYERAGYGVPQLVRKNWRIIDETPHFVIFQRP